MRTPRSEVLAFALLLAIGFAILTIALVADHVRDRGPIIEVPGGN